MTEYARVQHVEGLAALGICESLLLSLVDLKVMSEEQAHALLTDVATTHDDAASASSEPDKHRAVAEIVKRLIISMQR